MHNENQRRRPRWWRGRQDSSVKEESKANLSAILEEISDNWKLEAKSESIERYFFHVSEVKALENGKKAYVIGRKGTGKTAIAEFFYSRNEYNQFCEKLSFKNFPFNELYKLKNEGFSPTNQYITLWKYLIYSIICKLMVKNEAVRSDIREALGKVFSPPPLSTLARWITTWTATDFTLNILGTGGGAKGQLVNNEPNWIERVEVLERIIIEHIDESRYLILFDELDEDYRDMINPVQNSAYTSLLTGLFKAVQDVKATMARNGKSNVLPIVFLRDDIYSTIRDPDKTKWNDYIIELEWDAEKIKDLLAYRLSRAIDIDAPILTFSEAWGQVFSKKPIITGGGTGTAISVFDYMSRSTFFRPRDYISYIRDCARNALREKDRRLISPVLVKHADTAFSNYLKSEMIDEIQAVIPDISSVLDVISQIRKQTFTRAEFKAAYEKLSPVKKFTEKDSDWVLQVLFLFSVLGNQPKQKNQQVFRYRIRDANLNYDESLVVHRGLFKALQIL